MDTTEAKKSNMSSSSSSVIASKRAFARIDEQIENGSFYEAFQLVQTLYHRCVYKRHFNEACDLCMRFATKFAEKCEYDLSVEAAMFFIQALALSDADTSQEIIQQITQIFKKYPKFKAKHKYRFMNRALSWVKKKTNESNREESREYERQLHLCMAEAYIQEGSYGFGQGHLVFCNDGAKLANMVEEWQQYGYPSERHLFSLRVVLILIFLNDINSAENFIRSLHVDLDSQDVHPCIQFAYLLVMACKYRNKAFYDLVMKKYALVVRRDSSFDNFLKNIEKEYFNSSRKSDFNIFNVLNSFASLRGGGGRGGGAAVNTSSANRP